jgi:UDP-N-acetylglucosamine 2-epimerase (non-hydrolysing)
MKKVSLIFGTRPEAIKLCPLIKVINDTEGLVTDVCVTGQHREMLDQILDIFNVIPNCDLNLMKPNQTLAGLTSRAIAAIDDYLGSAKPDVVVVQGDTTTAFCAALCSFYHKIPVAHVEAGLRTWDNHSPFPEEINRVLTSRMTRIHFAPTATSKANLLKEGIDENTVFVTGNTVIDALFQVVNKTRLEPPRISELPDYLQPGTSGKDKVVLITGHRRENFGVGFENICQAIARLAMDYPDINFIYPMHLNPNVREPVARLLGDLTSRNVFLIEPLNYYHFVAMMDRAEIILTDSGGVQEEAPSLGKPVLVMRDTTERPEAVEMGTVKLVGTNKDAIYENVSLLLDDPLAYRKMANAVNPYGDGKACQRIASLINNQI